MKKSLLFVFPALLIFLCSSTLSFAQKGAWTLLGQNKPAPVAYQMSATPNLYQLYSLKEADMSRLLHQAGDSYETGSTILLPGKNNELEAFVVWETPMMGKKLAEQFPDIKTYTATSVADPYVSAKIDWTAYGFRAAIYYGGQILLIDPYDLHNSGYYMSFWTNDLDDNTQNFSCETNGIINPDASSLGTPIHVDPQSGHTVNRPNGSVRRTYKLAMACTGEFAVVATQNNPTPTNLLSVVVSTVNRINGVYEREISTSFSLVGDQVKILFSNSSTDPYSCNQQLDCLIDENQIVIDDSIGVNNYEIGHILCTGGGGLAALSSLCSQQIKARAASTSSGPSNFSTCLHEIGHQFSAGHTFSAESGGCSGNLMEQSAYEPGSGTTIMSYSGACAPNNISTIRSDYFHINSLISMTTYSQALINTCGVSTQGVNNVSVPASVSKEYTIPKNTPFELVAPNVMPTQQNASIAYNWEQYDLGNNGANEADGGNANEGPTFRSYPPSGSSFIRQFPPELILNNSYEEVGERLPKVARTLNFKFTARSVFQGWGSIDYTDDNFKITVTDDGPFRVTAPATAATYPPNALVPVNWTIANTNTGAIASSKVNIYLSIDGGQSFPILLASSVPNNGSAQVPMPNVATNQAYIRVQGTSNIFYDIAKGKLTITGDNTGLANGMQQEDIKIFPNPASQVLNINHSSKITKELKVQIYDLTGRLVWNGTINKQQISIPVASWARGNYQIRVVNPETAAYSTYQVQLN